MQAVEDPPLPVVHGTDLLAIKEDPERRRRELGMFGANGLDHRRHPAFRRLLVVLVRVADEQIPSQLVEKPFRRGTDRAAVAAGLGHDLGFAQPAIGGIRLDIANRAGTCQRHVEQFDDVLALVAGAPRDIGVFEMLERGRCHEHILAFVESQIFGNLADEALAEGLAGALLATDETERFPGLVPLSKPERLACRFATNQRDGGDRLSHGGPR